MSRLESEHFLKSGFCFYGVSLIGGDEALFVERGNFVGAFLELIGMGARR